MTELLRLSQIEKSYRRGERRLRVLAGVSLSVERGEIVAVIGSRYEGKTTLLRIASGIELPDAGEVIFEGRTLHDLSAREREQLLARSIAWVSREGTGLEFQVIDYVGLPLLIAGKRPRAVEDAALSVLERVGAADVARRYWAELSNWERVLVSFARAITTAPRLLVIDDVLDGLGMSKTDQATDLLRTLVSEHGCGVLMSASDPEAAIGADQVWSFAGGQLRMLAGRDRSAAEVILFPGGPGGRKDRSATGSDR
jgi:ABC-type lipoprotein export system ATPase subunit